MVGQNLLQSPDEWATRNTELARTLRELLLGNVNVKTGEALDLGCQSGALTDEMAATTPLRWAGVDPIIEAERTSPGGQTLVHGYAHAVPFEDGRFDCVLFANVFEHVEPKQRRASLREIARVLAPGGILVGQLPNPYFPIESHSRLPFMGYLPGRVQKIYWRLAPVHWKHDFYPVTMRDLRRVARRAGFEPVVVRNFNYPPEAVPARVRPLYRIARGVMAFWPWSWQFVFRKV